MSQTEQTLQDIIQDDEELDALAKETGLTSDEERRVLEDAFEKAAINEYFENSTYELASPNTGLKRILKDVKSTVQVFYDTEPYPSQGEIIDIAYDDTTESLTLHIEIIGTDDTIRREFQMSPETGPDKQLSTIIQKTQSRKYEPTTLIGKNVPITLQKYEDYAVDVGSFSIDNISIDTADGRVNSIDLDIDALEIDYSNIADESAEFDITVSAESPDTVEPNDDRTSASDDETDEFTIDTDTVSISDTPHDTVTSDLEGNSYDLISEGDFTEDSFFVPDDENDSFEIIINVEVDVGDISGIDTQTETTSFDVEIDNAAADADVDIEMSANGDPVEEPE